MLLWYKGLYNCPTRVCAHMNSLWFVCLVQYYYVLCICYAWYLADAVSVTKIPWETLETMSGCWCLTNGYLLLQVRPSVTYMISEPCTCCHATGRVEALETSFLKIEHEICRLLVSKIISVPLFSLFLFFFFYFYF